MKYYFKCYFFSLLVLLIFSVVNSSGFFFRPTIATAKILGLILFINIAIWLLIRYLSFFILMLAALFLSRITDFILSVWLFSVIFLITVVGWWLAGLSGFIYEFSALVIIFAGLFNISCYYLFVFNNHEAWLQGF